MLNADIVARYDSSAKFIEQRYRAQGSVHGCPSARSWRHQDASKAAAGRGGVEQNCRLFRCRHHCRAGICHQPGCDPNADGRTELGFRPLLLIVTFELFLLLVAGAVLARGRARRVFFAFIACTLPLVLLAALETLAGAVHLSDRVAMFQDMSTIKRGSNWGPGKNHIAPEQDGFVLYRPWSGNAVTINRLGLRTAPPSPKAPGEHRIAVVGSSETWGFRLADADTIPALLQAALHEDGHGEISVYNFGIEDATMARERALLRHFKDIYDIDQVLFVAGASDLYSEYFAIQGDLHASRMDRRIAGFELYRTIERIRSTWFEPSPDRLARLDAQISARPAAKSSGTPRWYRRGRQLLQNGKPSM